MNAGAPEPGPGCRACRALRWTLRWFLIAAAIILAGAVLGAALFPLGGWILGIDLPLTTMVRNGLHDGAFLALIWAPGAAFVICVMRAHAAKARRDHKFP